MPLHALQQELSRCLHRFPGGSQSSSCYCKTAFCCDQGCVDSLKALQNLTARCNYSRDTYGRGTAPARQLAVMPQTSPDGDHSSSARSVTEFFLIFASLPPELKIAVLSHLDSPSLLNITDVAVPQPYLWCPKWRLSSLRNIAETCVDIDAIIRDAPEHLIALATSHQYPVESFIRPRIPRSYVSGHRYQKTVQYSVLREDPIQYLGRLRKIETAVHVATNAIQSVFPKMGHTAMMRNTLTYMFDWARRNVESYDPVLVAQHQWNVFGWLPRSIKLEFDIFFNNMTLEFLREAPFKYPRTCEDRHCPNLTANVVPKNVSCCQDCGLHHCWWRLPSRIEHELDALGITYILARQHATCRIRDLLSAVSEMSISSREVHDMQSLDDYFIDKLYGGFSWRGALQGAEILSHGPGPELVIFLPASKLQIIMYGIRGSGGITIKVAPQHIAEYRDPHFMLARAMLLHQGQQVDLFEWDEELEYDGRVLMRREREAYWDILDGEVEEGLLNMLQ